MPAILTFADSPKRFTYIGDTATLRVELGRHTLEFVASIEADTDTTPDDFDAACYTPERLQEWRDGDWSYLGVIVEMRINGEEIDWQSLWGIDVGDDRRYLRCVANDLLGQFDLPLRTPSFAECYAVLDTPA